LVPCGAATRLISRNRIVIPGASPLIRAAYTFVMEPGSLVMERKMLLGIKQRAESLARDPDLARVAHSAFNFEPSSRRLAPGDLVYPVAGQEGPRRPR